MERNTGNLFTSFLFFGHRPLQIYPEVMKSTLVLFTIDEQPTLFFSKVKFI